MSDPATPGPEGQPSGGQAPSQHGWSGVSGLGSGTQANSAQDPGAQQYIPPGGGGAVPPRAQPRGGFAAGSRSKVWLVVIAVLLVALVASHRLTTIEVITFCVLIPSVILHEVAHGWVALAFGDDTA